MLRIYFSFIFVFCFLFTNYSFANNSEKKAFKKALLDVNNLCSAEQLAKHWPDDRKSNIKRVYKRFNEIYAECLAAMQALVYLVDDKLGLDSNSAFPILGPGGECPGSGDAPPPIVQPSQPATYVPPVPPAYAPPAYKPPAYAPPPVYVPPVFAPPAQVPPAMAYPSISYMYP